MILYMSDIFFKVYKSSIDQYNWDKHIEFASLMELPDELRKEYIESLTFFKK